MTEHEMRIRLVEAMGYHRCKKYRGSPSAPWMGPDGAYTGTVPDPLESDRDAALLRAWLVRQEWCSSLAVTTDSRDVEVTIYDPAGDPFDDTPETVTRGYEPDPLRRERLALCRAVIQALDTVDAGGEA